MRPSWDNSRPKFFGLLIVAVALALTGCRGQTEGREAPKPSEARSASLSGARIAVAPGQEDGQWLMPAKNYASTRFSGLGQINAGNVRNLKVAWTFSTGNTRGHEAAPLVVGGTMYVVGPFPKPSREFPRLCRGGSSSLTFKDVSTVETFSREPPSTREEKNPRWTSLRV